MRSFTPPPHVITSAFMLWLNGENTFTLIVYIDTQGWNYNRTLGGLLLTTTSTGRLMLVLSVVLRPAESKVNKYVHISTTGVRNSYLFIYIFPRGYCSADDGRYKC